MHFFLAIASGFEAELILGAEESAMTVYAGTYFIDYPSRSDQFKVWNFSDLHMLSKHCSDEMLLELRQEIKADPFAYWFGGGDYVDMIGYDDGKRFDPDCVSDKLSIRDLGRLGKRSVEEVREFFAPIADCGLGLLLGNHEKSYQKSHMQEDLHAWLCTELGLPNFGYCVFFDLSFRRMSALKKPRLARPGTRKTSKATGSSARWRVFAHHGAGYAQTPGGKLNRLIQFMDGFDADIYFCGHVHDKISKCLASVGGNADCTQPRQIEKLGVISGGYLKSYAPGVNPSYAEQRGYRPVPLGASWAGIEPDKGRSWTEISCQR